MTPVHDIYFILPPLPDQGLVVKQKNLLKDAEVFGSIKNRGAFYTRNHELRAQSCTPLLPPPFLRPENITERQISLIS